MILNISGSSSVRNALDKRYHWTSVDPSDGAVLLWDRLADFPLAPDSDDELSWKWTASGGYTASSAYLTLHNGATQLNGADRIWKTWAPLQVKFFLWLAVKHRHWTSDRRLRHGLTADPIYRHCDQENESSDHIIFRCSYSLQVWWVFLAPLHFQDITPQAMESLQDWWARLRSFLPPALHCRPPHGPSATAPPRQLSVDTQRLCTCNQRPSTRSHRTVDNSLITARRRYSTFLNLPLDECIVNTPQTK